MDKKKAVTYILFFNIVFTVFIALVGFDLKPLTIRPSLLFTHSYYLVLNIFLFVLVMNAVLAFFELRNNKGEKKEVVVPIVAPIKSGASSFIENKKIGLDEVTFDGIKQPETIVDNKPKIFLDSLKEDVSFEIDENNNESFEVNEDKGFDKIIAEGNQKSAKAEEHNVYTGIHALLNTDYDNEVMDKIMKAEALQKGLMSQFEGAGEAMAEAVTGQKKKKSVGRFKEMSYPIEDFNEE
jgi:hypothetical protein